MPHAGDTIVGQEVIMPSFELVLPSYKESADFFGVELAYSPLMAEQYLVSCLSTHEEINEAGFWGILSREPGVMSIIWPSELFGYKGAIVQISTNSYFGDEEAIVSITASFRVIDSTMYSESTYHKVQAFSVFPLRIDLFDEQIAESMIQKFWEYDDPCSVTGTVAGDEDPQILFGTIESGITPIYAMTEEEALEIRSIIDSAVAGSRFNSIIAVIMNEEVQSFLNGLRSSADTARIIQNRVQRYFDEQEW